MNFQLWQVLGRLSPFALILVFLCSPALAQGNRLGSEGLQLIAQSLLGSTSLRELVLCDNVIGSVSLSSFSCSPRVLPHVSTAAFPAPLLCPCGMWAVMRGLWCPILRALTPQ